MKSFLLSILLLLGLTIYSALMAQPPQDSVYLYIETELSNDTIQVYVRGLNINNVASVQFFIEVDINNYNVFNLETFAYPNDFNGIIAGPALFSQVAFSWNSPNGGVASVPDGEPLCGFKLKPTNPNNKLCLNFKNDKIRFLTEFIDINGNLIPTRDIGSCQSLNLTLITGKIYGDLNSNCLNENNENGLQGAVIKLTKSGNQYDIVSNKKGEYIKFVDAGIYEMSIYHPSMLWNVCTFNTTVDATEKTKTIKLTNYLNPFVSCPNLEVELTNSRLRICSENSLAINYFNYGTIAAINSYVELKLDPRLELSFTSIPFVSLGNDLYRLDIGNINAVEGGTINATVKTTCDVEELNKSICMEARIFPNEYCGPLNPLWSGADLSLDSRCVNDKVEFTIKNIGKGNMNQELNYAIVEDDLMPNGLSRLKLNQNESKVIEVPANGKTIRLITDTIPYHPYKVRYSAAIEACGINNKSKGFISKFSFGDEDPHLDIFCNTLRGSYDPNDKAGTPLGTGLENNIQKTDRIQYLIRFQNTGSDTAFRVEVIDTISEQLDLGSLKVIGASHPFTWSNKEDRTLKFLFNKIKLVDSTTNEKESNGYVLYSIKPKEYIPYKTKIYNHADIYFDFNPPIRTNTTLHTIAEPITIVSDPDIDYNVRVYPNPTIDKFVVDLSEISKNTVIEVSDIFGRIVIHQILDKSTNIIALPTKLLPGTYYFIIKKNNLVVSRGNIIKH